jgi:pantetheine-phosphate adenylyltransferase
MSNTEKRNAIYAGSFDPVTYGHIDVITRASRIFDQIIIGVSAGPKKTFFSHRERINLVAHLFKNDRGVIITGFSSLLVAFARKCGTKTIIRGIRAVSDFDYELQLTLANRKLAPDIETVFLMPSEKFIFISSSLVKEIALLNGDISHLVPKSVAAALKRKLRRRKKR